MWDEKVKNEAVEIMGLFQVLPRLVVFDLDHTLWPFYCGVRSKREMPSLYPHAKGILQALKEKGTDLAIASRTPAAGTANTFLDKLDLSSLFVAREIFPTLRNKRDHFQRIKMNTGVPYQSMLLFDDEYWNIEEAEEMGVTGVLVEDGVTLRALRVGLRKFSQGLVTSNRRNRK